MATLPEASSPAGDAAFFGKLKGVAKKIVENLQEPSAVRLDPGGQISGQVNRKGQALADRHLPEEPLTVPGQVRQHNGGHGEGQLARLHLGQVENLVDQVE